MRFPSKMLLAALVAVVSPELAHAASDLVITDPISRATPAGASTGIGYMTITNTGQVPELPAVFGPQRSIFRHTAPSTRRGIGDSVAADLTL